MKIAKSQCEYPNILLALDASAIFNKVRLDLLKPNESFILKYAKEIFASCSSFVVSLGMFRAICSACSKYDFRFSKDNSLAVLAMLTISWMESTCGLWAGSCLGSC